MKNITHSTFHENPKMIKCGDRWQVIAGASKVQLWFNKYSGEIVGWWLVCVLFNLQLFFFYWFFFLFVWICILLALTCNPRRCWWPWWDFSLDSRLRRLRSQWLSHVTRPAVRQRRTEFWSCDFWVSFVLDFCFFAFGSQSQVIELFTKNWPHLLWFAFQSETTTRPSFL